MVCEALGCGKQSILHGVFGILRVAHDAERGMKKRALMAVKEGVQGLCVAALARLYQAFFIHLRAQRSLGCHRIPHSS